MKTKEIMNCKYIKPNLKKTPPEGMTVMEQYNQGYLTYEEFNKIAAKIAREKNKKIFEELGTGVRKRNRRIL
jgi:hypothetical protein